MVQIMATDRSPSLTFLCQQMNTAGIRYELKLDPDTASQAGAKDRNPIVILSNGRVMKLMDALKTLDKEWWVID